MLSSPCRMQVTYKMLLFGMGAWRGKGGGMKIELTMFFFFFFLLFFSSFFCLGLSSQQHFSLHKACKSTHQIKAIRKRRLFQKEEIERKKRKKEKKSPSESWRPIRSVVNQILEFFPLLISKCTHANARTHARTLTYTIVFTTHPSLHEYTV